MNSDGAFRESLFDALGDDEGAAFWEGVYGQPIHDYPNTYVDEDTGDLEQMDDEQYAQYVRGKMWEKSREGVEAAREEKRRQRAQEKQKVEQERKAAPKVEKVRDQDDFVFDFEIDASLRRGQRRKEQKRYKELWQDYVCRWQELQDLAKDDVKKDSQNLFLRNKIVWPVETGKRKDVKPEEIESFIKKGVEGSDTDDVSHQNILLNAVKQERIRSHPDMIQQRYGFMRIDEDTMKGVTAVFQVFDAMWNQMRPRKSD